jgi:hypothetical protein
MGIPGSRNNGSVLLVDVLLATWYKSEAPNTASSVSALLTQVVGHRVWPTLILYPFLVLPNFSRSSVLKLLLTLFQSWHVGSPRLQLSQGHRW